MCINGPHFVHHQLAVVAAHVQQHALSEAAVGRQRRQPGEVSEHPHAHPRRLAELHQLPHLLWEGVRERILDNLLTRLLICVTTYHQCYDSVCYYSWLDLYSP